MSSTHTQCLLPEKAGKFELITVPTPTPGPNEINVRTKAVGLNPVDLKIHREGILVESWPTVLGLEFSGVVDSVGPSVTAFKPGDEVYGFRGQGNPGAAFQEIITVPSSAIVEKPTSYSFEEAASLPIGYFTAAAGVVVGLDVPLPWAKRSANSSPRSILVIGGSSAVGSAAIQILREALPSAQILTTASAKHHAHLKALGADVCFERAVQADVTPVRSAAVGGDGVDVILDTVAAAAAQAEIFGALREGGPRVYSHIATGVKVEGPEGLGVRQVFAADILKVEGGMGVLKALEGGIERGTYKLPIRVEVVGKGFEVIPGALERFVEGVSGTKLVVQL